MRNTAALLIACMCLSGCFQSKTTEDVVRETMNQMMSKTSIVNPSEVTLYDPLPKHEPKPEPNLEEVARLSANIKELKVEDIVVGSGAVAVEGRFASVLYRGMLPDGYVFDTNVETNPVPKERTTFRVEIGAGQVVKGFEDGIKGMRVGGVRRITIPARLGYGASPPAGSSIPPNSALIFDVHLMFVGDTP